MFQRNALFLLFLIACSPRRRRDPPPPPTCDPIVCNDGDPCTDDAIAGSGCNATCQFTPSADPRCNVTCGNGQLDQGELCDTAIATGAGRCPTASECNDDLACTRDELVLAGGDACRASCANLEITEAGPVDGCCPSGAAPGSDDDCAGCGDGVVGANETCDTAIPSGPNACPTSCDDGDACTIDQLVGAGTCSAACSRAQNTSLVGGDGCCLVQFTYPSLDADCPKLELGYQCNIPFDCTSNRCEYFDTYQASACTTGCSPQAPDHEGGCPPAATFEPVCLSAAQASNGGAQNVCVYFEPTMIGFAELAPDDGYMWSFTDPNQVHVWMIPSYGDGVARSWQVTMMPMTAGLDLAGNRLDPALLASGAACNAGGAGVMESCTLSVTPAEASERFWFAVYPQAGLGDYQIVLTLQ